MRSRPVVQLLLGPELGVGPMPLPRRPARRGAAPVHQQIGGHPVEIGAGLGDRAAVERPHLDVEVLENVLRLVRRCAPGAQETEQFGPILQDRCLESADLDVWRVIDNRCSQESAKGPQLPA